MIQVAQLATSAQPRQLFVTIILFCNVGDKKTLFDNIWQLLAEDMQYRLQQTFDKINYNIFKGIFKKLYINYS